MPRWLSAFGSERALLTLWSLVLFSVCFSLDRRHNDFPFYYHPDEPGKAEQVITGRWNFHHPMGLLMAANLAVDVFHVPREEQPVVEAGRDVSTAFCALAVVALSLFAFLWRGWLPALCAGAALGVHHQLFELAHYLKEDTALLLGIALAFLCALAYEQVPSRFRAALLGVACALAISGKYVGVVAVAIAVAALGAAPRTGRKGDLAWCAAALVATLALVNAPLLLDPSGFAESFSREVNLVVEGQGDTTRRVPHALYWNVFVDNTNPVVWLLLIAFLGECWRRRATLGRTQRVAVLFPFAFAVALSFSPKENDRYFLPASALFTLLAALGVKDVARLLATLLAAWGGTAHPERLLEGRPHRRITSTAAGCLLAVQLFGWAQTKPGWLRYDAAFQRDDLRELVAWMKGDLPAQSVVAADSRVGLPNPERRKHAVRAAEIPQRLIVKKLVSDVAEKTGRLDELRAAGITHVAISESSYGRFFRGDLRAKEDKGEKFTRAKGFYEQLLRDGELVFERERGTVIYLHPGIRVYRIQR